VLKESSISLNGTVVEGDRIRGTSLVVRDENNEYKILGTSGWSGQASEGVYTPKSVSNLDYETIYYESNLGKFPAYLTNDGDVGIVIFVHGFRGDYSREVFAKMRAGEIVDMGYRSMIISYRNDKGLPKDPSGIFQYGTTEWEDIDAAINKALEFTDNVVLFGTSGGGGPISSWLENVGDENKVKESYTKHLLLTSGKVLKSTVLQDTPGFLNNYLVILKFLLRLDMVLIFKKWTLLMR
jgi:pimeloyl-ACP methyl ester carboxylesterase